MNIKCARCKVEKPIYNYIKKKNNEYNKHCNKNLIIKTDKPKDPKLITIERKDNKLGHIKDNCILACYTCNVTRQDKYTHEEFIKIKQ